MFWRLLYNSLFVPLGWAVLRLYGLVNAKARRGIIGRRGLFARLETTAAAWDARGPGGARGPTTAKAPRVWFHASSMGEFEQAKPIITMLKERRPDVKVAVTFFSPSGYENSLAYKEADLITYIPFDSPGNARRFVRLLRPSAAVVMRYDVWPNHAWALRDAGVPAILANATIRGGGLRNLSLFRGYHRSVYDALHTVLTVTDEDRDRCLGYGVSRAVVETAGDTRYDQVARRCEDSRRRRYFPEEVLRGKTVVVIGSSWEEDERLLVPALADLRRSHPDLLAVIVPHEPTVGHLAALEARLNGLLPSIRFSQMVSYAGEPAVIVDSVGILMALYQYAQIAYVGGGFGEGVHSVLEPAAYGVPVVIGPNHRNSREAGELAGRGGLIATGDGEGLRETLAKLLADAALRGRMGKTALEFTSGRLGATARILSTLEKVL